MLLQPTVAKTCPGDAQIQKLSPEDQELFVKLHNTYRSRLANGSIQKFSPASKMREVSWDHQLAFLAAINVAQCQMNHDNCRATQNAVQPGQNLYMGMKTGSFYTNSEVIKNSVDVWFNEFVYASQSDLTHCCGPNNNL